MTRGLIIFPYKKFSFLVTLSLLIILILTPDSVNCVSRRRFGKPPGAFGRTNQDQNFNHGNDQTEQLSTNVNEENQLEYGGLDDNDFGDIQQSTIFHPPPPPPARYTGEPTGTSENDNVIDVDEKPEVATSTGTYQGTTETVNGRDVFVFYGIRYAKAPIGKLRFRRPVEFEAQPEETFDATTKPNSCPQTVTTVFNDFSGEAMWNPNTNTSEDCLFLNVWVPKEILSKQPQSKNVPVIFWIYGGGFFSGSSTLDIYNGAKLAESQGVIVVSVQYRLGPLGFFYLGTDEAPGNMGLIDQSVALKWTVNNIANFGGDPEKITASGESCGAASVGFHLVSPLSKKYLKRGIMASGLPSADYALTHPEELKQRSLTFARNAGCHQKDFSKMVHCLQEVDPDKLTALQWKEYKHMLDFPFSPTVDGYFLPDDPDNLILRGKAKRADLMMGTVNDEGTFFMLYHYLNYFSHRKPTSVTYDSFVDIMSEIFYKYSEPAREAIIAQYTNWVNPEDGFANQRKIGEAVGDAVFVCPHKRFADQWASRGLGVYYYHLTHRFSTNPWAKWMGVMHGDDVPLLFGNSGLSTTFTEREAELNENFMGMVGNFAKTGVPSQKWERYSSEYPVYLDVNSTVITDSSTPQFYGPREGACAFWNKILPMIGPNQHQSQHPHPSQLPSPPQFGIHGGQGFHFPMYDNFQSPMSPQLQTPCGFSNMMYQSSPPPNYFGHSQTQPPPQCVEPHVPGTSTTSNPTKESCECSVREESTSNGPDLGQINQFITPPPAIF